MIEYIIVDTDKRVPKDRVRLYALWHGWFGYDRPIYTQLSHDVFDPLTMVYRVLLPAGIRKSAKKNSLEQPVLILT